jgi:hypothetical protein
LTAAMLAPAWRQIARTVVGAVAVLGEHLA